MECLSIGGVTIAVRHSGVEPQRWAWQDPLARFLTRCERPEVELAVRIGEPPARSATATPLFDSDAVWQLYRDNRQYRLECRSEAFGPEPYKTAIFDATFTSGSIYLRESVSAIHPLDYPLDEVLVVNLLGRGRGVELHSCGIIDQQGRGHLFVGVSGAGKTTTARLWEGASSGIVSDDRVIVRERDGVMHMFGTPWHGEAELSMARSVPLAGVYLLVQAAANDLRPIEPAEAVARLFRCTFPVFYDAAALEYTVGFLERLAASVPVRELQFVRDRSVVDLVLREVA